MKRKQRDPEVVTIQGLGAYFDALTRAVNDLVSCQEDIFLADHPDLVRYRGMTTQSTWDDYETPSRFVPRPPAPPTGEYIERVFCTFQFRWGEFCTGVHANGFHTRVAAIPGGKGGVADVEDAPIE